MLKGRKIVRRCAELLLAERVSDPPDWLIDLAADRMWSSWMRVEGRIRNYQPELTFGIGFGHDLKREHTAEQRSIPHRVDLAPDNSQGGFADD